MPSEAKEFHKSLSQPDERREFKAHGHLDLVQLGPDVSVGRAEFEPGWKWKEDVGPIAGTKSCQASHAGYCLSGTMVIRMDDGHEFTITAGDAFRIPPGHDAWVLGGERCVMIDVGGYTNYAKPASNAA